MRRGSKGRVLILPGATREQHCPSLGPCAQVQGAQGERKLLVGKHKLHNPRLLYFLDGLQAAVRAGFDLFLMF